MQNKAFSLTLNRLISSIQKDSHCGRHCVPSQSEGRGLKPADSCGSEKCLQTGAQRLGWLPALGPAPCGVPLVWATFMKQKPSFVYLFL